MMLPRWVEGVGAAVLIGTIVNAYLFLRTNGFLPPPFFFNYRDSLMDGYNTAAWSFRNGAYEIWRSVYPPISFAWFKLFATGSCYAGSEVFARDCDWWLRTAMLGFFFGNVVLVWVAYRRTNRATALPRAIAVGLGMPMLYALERANLIIPAFTFFVLAYGPLVKSARWRWVCAAAAANFKPYLLAAIFSTLLRRQWRWFEGAIVACVVVYVVTWLIVGDGTPMQILRNTVIFADSGRIADWPVAHYPSSYLPLHAFLGESKGPLVKLLGSGPLDLAAWLLPVLMRGSQVLAMAAAAAIWVKPELFPRTRSAALAVMVALSLQETGGYAVCFAMFLVFFEEGRGFCRIAALLIAYLLNMCYDYFLVQLDFQLMVESYLGGRPVSASYGLSVGTLLRPAGLLLIMDLLAFATLHRLWAALRAEGRVRMPAWLRVSRPTPSTAD
ncbi:hypothetical protein [Sphingomonas sp.]|uniref:hypothetical protein n=1 Tax=Sphingomonas sp. TaxID=28214 RepID=UPI0035BBDA7F